MDLQKHLEGDRLAAQLPLRSRCMYDAKAPEAETTKEQLARTLSEAEFPLSVTPCEGDSEEAAHSRMPSAGTPPTD